MRRRRSGRPGKGSAGWMQWFSFDSFMAYSTNHGYPESDLGLGTPRSVRGNHLHAGLRRAVFKRNIGGRAGDLKGLRIPIFAVIGRVENAVQQLTAIGVFAGPLHRNLALVDG